MDSNVVVSADSVVAQPIPPLPRAVDEEAPERAQKPESVEDNGKILDLYA